MELTALILLVVGATFILVAVTEAKAQKAQTTREDVLEVLGLAATYLGAAILFAREFPNLGWSLVVAVFLVLRCGLRLFLKR